MLVLCLLGKWLPHTDNHYILLLVLCANIDKSLKKYHSRFLFHLCVVFCVCFFLTTPAKETNKTPNTKTKICKQRQNKNMPSKNGIQTLVKSNCIPMIQAPKYLQIPHFMFRVIILFAAIIKLIFCTILAVFRAKSIHWARVKLP